MLEEIYQAISTYLHRVMTYNPLVVGVQLLLIGVVVWWVKRFLRGTRGARLLKGTALLLAMVYVAVRLLPKGDQWRRVEFLYGNFLIFVGVAAVVAFQPELRRALVRIGQTSLFSSHVGRLELLVSELVKSTSYLSRNKIGAIVAIERKVGLAGLMRTGTAMDANLTAPLINTIFYPKSALHDMGMIISEGCISAAGCQFPLAESAEVDQSLGSRHRAALGLARETDAVILVVSEETGRISLAFDGQLSLGIKQDDLGEMLLTLLAPKSFLKKRAKAKRADK